MAPLIDISLSNKIIQTVVRFALAGFYPKSERTRSIKESNPHTPTLGLPRGRVLKHAVNALIGVGQEKGIMGGMQLRMTGNIYSIVLSTQRRQRKSREATLPKASHKVANASPRSHSPMNEKPPLPTPSLTRLEQEITHYHTIGAYTPFSLGHTIISHHGHEFNLSTLTPAQRINLMGYLFRSAYDLEASMIPQDLRSQCPAPSFWPEQCVEDDERWRYYDHEGNVRPEAYLLMCEETGERAPYGWEQVRVWEMERVEGVMGWLGREEWGRIWGWVRNGGGVGVRKGGSLERAFV